MSRVLALLFLAWVAAAPASAADEAAEKPKSGNKVERALDNAGAAVEKMADKAVGGIKKGVDTATKAMDDAGNKTGRWLKEKTE